MEFGDSNLAAAADLLANFKCSNSIEFRRSAVKFGGRQINTIEAHRVYYQLWMARIAQKVYCEIPVNPTTKTENRIKRSD